MGSVLGSGVGESASYPVAGRGSTQRNPWPRSRVHLRVEGVRSVITPSAPSSRGHRSPIRFPPKRGKPSIRHTLILNLLGSHSPLAANRKRERQNTPPLGAGIVYLLTSSERSSKRVLPIPTVFALTRMEFLPGNKVSATVREVVIRPSSALVPFELQNASSSLVGGTVI